MGLTERLALSWGKCPAVYKTAAVATEPRRQKRFLNFEFRFLIDRTGCPVVSGVSNRKSRIKMESGGSPQCCPLLCHFKEPWIASKLSNPRKPKAGAKRHRP